MKRILVGHRGVGKTSLFLRHQEYFKNIKHFDLDTEVEKVTQTDIQTIFIQKSEVEFRQIEKNIFQNLIAENSFFVISLGAGFDISTIPKEFEILFVSRLTDKNGRLFLNRPRLNLEMTALEESIFRYQTRQSKFLQNSTNIYFMPEGIHSENKIEKHILQNTYYINDAYYTVSVQDLNHIDLLISHYMNLELRTDLLDEQQIEAILKKYPYHNWLISFRNSVSQEIRPNNHCTYDWDIDLGSMPESLKQPEQKLILSSHGEIKKAIADLDQWFLQESEFKHLDLKLSPVIESFEDLILGYEWQQQDPSKRSFLPRSSDGRWLWFRQLSKYKQKINFIRNFTNLSDQPSLYQWLVLPMAKPKTWGAVLGSPISFSRSPIQHEEYKKYQHSYFTSILITADELKQNLSWLKSLGLTEVAVTAPLKEAAYEIADLKTEATEKLKSANTLFIKDKIIFSHNTDLIGFQKLVADFQFLTAIIWGGGGTLNMMQSVLPNAVCFSSQTGEPRDSKTHDNQQFQTLIWAAPRSEKTKLPTLEQVKQWNLKCIIDLNYVENSMGLELAQNLISNGYNIKYINGIEMFIEQAVQQQKFWSAQ